MKLKNKKTGEIIETVIVDHGAEWEIRNMYTDEGTQTYDSLAELNEGWEDAPEEPKDFYIVEQRGIVGSRFNTGVGYVKQFKEIGNYFETKEEAKQAVERLRAWKRLKDKGFRTEGWTFDDGLRISICTNIDSEGIYDDDKKEMKKDLDICFGGEE